MTLFRLTLLIWRHIIHRCVTLLSTRSLWVTRKIRICMPPIVGLALYAGCNTELVFLKTALQGANGITFDANGRLYIASVRGNEIVIADPATGSILKRLG